MAESLIEDMVNYNKHNVISDKARLIFHLKTFRLGLFNQNSDLV